MASSMLSGDRRFTSGRRGGMTILGKVAVPKSINLPSQRLENHGLDPSVKIVPKVFCPAFFKVINQTLFCSEDFHSKVAEAAKRLPLKEHSVLDGHYLLDLMRVTPRDANYTGPGSRFCILRLELINAFCQEAEAIESSKSKSKSGPAEQAHVNDESSKLGVEKEIKTEASTDATQNDSQDKNEVDGGSESAPAETESSKLHEELFFNPNVFTEFKLAGSSEEIAADEEIVKNVSSYLVDVVLPNFVQDLSTLEVSPMDGQSLTEALHAHGIWMDVKYE